MSRMFIATEAFWAKDIAYPVHKDVTIVSEDSDLYKRFPQYFREVAPDDQVGGGVEQATAGPGEKRAVSIGGARASARASAKTKSE
jgi:hypothetical protein